MANITMQLFERFWAWRIKETPEFASLSGIKEYNDQLEEYTVGRFEENRSACHSFLQEAEEILKQNSGSLNAPDLLNLRLFKAELKTFINGFEFKGFLFPINFMEGVHVDFERLSGWVQLKTVKDFEDLIQRYRKFQNQAAQIIGVLKTGMETKMTNHAISMEGVLELFDKHISKSARETIFYDPFKTFPEDFDPVVINKLQEQSLQAITDSVQPGMRDIHNFLQDEYMRNLRPIFAATSLPNGKAFYQECIKFHTSTNMTAKEIHDTGLSEVHKIETEMKRIVSELGFDKTLPDFMNMLRNDPKFFHTNQDDLLADFKDIVENKIAPSLMKIFSKFPEHKLDVVPGIQEDCPAAYYICGTADGSRPGKFFVNVKKFKSQPKYEMMTLALHEANPGHHLQGSFQLGMKGTPKFRQLMEDRSYFMSPSRFPINTAYMEGWALYAESLGTELGLYDDPYIKFGHLSNNIFRACRLVVDTGLHALNWTRQQAVDFMMEHSASSIENIEGEVNRYITWPGQALGYKIGEIKIRSLRQKAEQKLGSKFNLKEFHDVVLQVAGPLNVLEEEVDSFIAQKLN